MTRAVLPLMLLLAALSTGCPSSGDDDASDDDDDAQSQTPTPIPLRLDSIDPSNALASAAITGVAVHGTGFTASTVVALDGVDATGCTLQGGGTLLCAFAAGGTANHVDVTADDPVHGSDTLAAAFTWTLVLNETDVAGELDFCNVQFPATTTVAAGVPTEAIFGQFFEAGVTDTTVGQAPGYFSELGVGPSAADPTTSNEWHFLPAVFNIESGNNDEYVLTLTIAAAGTYSYTYRVSPDGVAYTYCDTDGAGSNGGLTFEAANLGVVTVTP